MADTTTAVTTRVPDVTLAIIEHLADAEHRTRNNMILVLLGEALDARKQLREAS